jgi:glycosyltransferase involved in cell wall biosynthesis
MHSLYYVYPVEFPATTAHCVQIYHTLNAIAANGVRVRLLVQRPKWFSGACPPIEWNGVRRHELFDLQYLPRLKWLSRLYLNWEIIAASIAGSRIYSRKLNFGFGMGWIERVSVVEVHVLRAKSISAARRFGRVVAITSSLREELINLGVPDANIHVAPSGVDLNLASTISMPECQSAQRLVYFGQLAHWKGVEVAIRSLLHHPLPLLVIGGKRQADLDYDRKMLERLSFDLNLKSRVQFTGYIPQRAIKELLRPGDVGVVPTLPVDTQDISNSPLKLFEYLAFGIPVVASRLRGLDDVVKDRESCIFFNPGCELDLGDAVNHLIADARLYQKLAEKGPKLVKSYTWDARARKILSFLDAKSAPE